MFVSCCGERELIISNLIIYPFNQDQIYYSDTLDVNSKIVASHKAETLKDCKYSSCIDEVLKNEILEDEFQLKIDKPIAIGSNIIEANTDLIANSLTNNQISITTKPYFSQQ